MTRAAAAMVMLLAAGDAFAQAEQAPETPEQRERRESRDRRAQEAEERERARENEAANEVESENENNANQNASRKNEARKWNLAVAPRLSLLLGDGPVGLSRVGYGIGLRLHFSFVTLGPLRFGAGFHFAHDRFGWSGQTLAHSSFAGVLLLDALFGRVRPFVGAGGGFSVAVYQEPHQLQGSPPQPYDIAGVVPLVDVTFGVGVRVYAGFEIGLRGDFEVTFSSDTGGMQPRTLFSPGLIGLNLDLALRF